MINNKGKKLIENFDKSAEKSIFPFFYRQLEESIIEDNVNSDNFVQTERAILYNSNKMQCFEFYKYVSRCF
jgi:hypothetical protein